MKKKRALIVINLAGFINFLWNDISTLQKMGYEVSVAMNEKLKNGSEAVEIPILNQMGISHYHIDFDTKSPFNKQNLIAFKQLKQIINNGYDVIHCHTPIAGILTRIAAFKYRKEGTKVIYTTHGFAFTDRSSKKSWIIYFTIEKIMSLFCDAIITINHEDYNNAKKMYCKKVYIIPSVGLDNEKFRNVKINREDYRKSLGVNKDDIMVLTVGELSERKNQQVIIKAIGCLPNKEKYNLVICGHSIVNSTIKEELTELSKKLNVRLQMLGHRTDMPEINACADVAVISSIREGFGMTGVEAMAAGVPVVGSDVQGIREYVKPEKTGFLCNPMDPYSFAEAIDKVVKMNDKRRKEMKMDCLDMALNFDKSKSSAEMKKIYQEVLEGI